MNIPPREQTRAGDINPALVAFQACDRDNRQHILATQPSERYMGTMENSRVGRRFMNNSRDRKKKKAPKK
jgi:hypothetical protein